MRARLFFSGSRTVTAGAQYCTALLNICLQNGIDYRDFSYGADGSVSFRLSLLAARRLMRLCAASGVVLHVVRTEGLPHWLFLYKKRAGIWVGTLIALFLLLVSERFVWDIRINGNAAMTESEILEELRACGLHIGAYIPDLHTPELENRLLLSSDRLSWVSVYLDGTVARVQVIEHTAGEEGEDLSRPANLIAAADGQIEFVELLRGNCVVKTGQAVKNGELLVSGIYDSNVTGYRWTRASGKVLARTEHSFRIEIPLAGEQKLYAEPTCAGLTFNFFDFSLEIFKKNGKNPPTCDIIKEDKVFSPFGMHDLPVSLTVERAFPYVTEAYIRTPEEALLMAYAELERTLGTLSADAQLLRKDIAATIGENSVILDCTVLCMEDIAVQQEFEITDLP